MTPRERRLWCAGRASVHLDVAIAQLADVVPCVEVVDPGLAADIASIARRVWAVREALFTVVEEYTEDENGDPDMETTGDG